MFENIAEFYRAWLDLERGAIPVRQQFWSGREGQRFEEIVERKPSQITFTKEIRQLQNGAWYAAVTMEEHWGVDPDAPQPKTIEEWEKLRAEKRTLPTVVHDRYTWNCYLAEADVSRDDEFFVLRFPTGIEYYDLDAKKYIGAPDPQPPVKPGQAAPDLDVTAWMDGKQHSLEEFRGRVVFLDFWGLWCGACRSAVPQFQVLQENYKDQPVVFISVHTAEQDSGKLAERIKKYTQKEDWQFLAAIDQGTMIANSQTTVAYGVQGFPSQVLIGTDGVVVYNSEIPPPGLEDVFGKSEDEITEEGEAKYYAYMKQRFEDAGEAWPEGGAGISQEEFRQRATRVYLFHMSRRIDEALKRAAQ